MSKGKPKAAAKGTSDYLRLSRGWATSLLFIVPLLVVYEVGVAALPADPLVAAHVVKWPLSFFGGRAALIFNGVVIALVLAALVHLMRRDELKLFVFPIMLAESAAYGLLLGPVTSIAVYGFSRLAGARASPGSVAAWVVIAAGAGVYEEIVFRGVLIGLLFYLFSRVLEMKPVLAGVVSILAAAAIFSAMHYLGPAGDEFTGGSFLFRLVAALLLTGIFLGRGLGIVCYAHAIYDVVVVLSLARH